MIPKDIDIVAIYRALGDNIRLGMVRHIAKSESVVASCTVVSACASLLALSQPAISHHFAKLVSSGVLTEQKQGSQKIYSLNRELLCQAGIDIDKLIS